MSIDAKKEAVENLKTGLSALKTESPQRVVFSRVVRGEVISIGARKDKYTFAEVDMEGNGILRLKVDPHHIAYFANNLYKKITLEVKFFEE